MIPRTMTTLLYQAYRQYCRKHGHVPRLAVTLLWSILATPAVACPLIESPIQDVKGNAITGAGVTIYLKGTITLANVYTDDLCTSLGSNPVLTDSIGVFRAYVQDGLYDVLPAKAGYTFLLVEDIPADDPYTVVSPSYSTSITINRASAATHTITATNGVAFAINEPAGVHATGSRLTVTIRNTSGGALGAITWNAAFKMPTFTAPATGFSRSVIFYWNGTNWIQTWQSASDVPN